MRKSRKSTSVAVVDFGTNSTEHRRTLRELEEAITQAECTFVFTGLALTKIREEKLYTEAGYKTFEAYCRGRWGFSRQRAYQLIDAASLAVHLTTVVDTVSPANEVQIRPLVGRDLDEAAEIWKHAIDIAAGAPVTGTLVKKAIKELFGENPKPGKTVADLIERVFRSCGDLANHFGETDLSSLDPKDKSCLLSAAREVMKLASKLNVPTRPTATPVRTRKKLIAEAKSLCRSLTNPW